MNLPDSGGATESGTTSVLVKVFKLLLDEIAATVAESGNLSNEQLLLLKSIFPSLISPALNLVDRKIYCYVEPANRRVYQMKVKSEQLTILPPLNFCPCDFFEKKILDTYEERMCEHLLAVHLAIATRHLTEVPTTTDQVTELIASAFF